MTPRTPTELDAAIERIQEATSFTREEWLTLPILVAFRRYSNAHFATCADEYNEGASDAAVKRRYDACDAAEKAFIFEIKATFTALRDARKDGERLEQTERVLTDLLCLTKAVFWVERDKIAPENLKLLGQYEATALKLLGASARAKEGT